MPEERTSKSDLSGADHVITKVIIKCAKCSGEKCYRVNWGNLIFKKKNWGNQSLKQFVVASADAQYKDSCTVNLIRYRVKGGGRGEERI